VEGVEIIKKRNYKKNLLTTSKLFPNRNGFFKKRKYIFTFQLYVKTKTKTFLFKDCLKYRVICEVADGSFITFFTADVFYFSVLCTPLGV